MKKGAPHILKTLLILGIIVVIVLVIVMVIAHLTSERELTIEEKQELVNQMNELYEQDPPSEQDRQSLAETLNNL